MPILVTGLVYLVLTRDWFMIYALNVCVSLSALFLAFICPESPRWLLYNGRQAEAIDALNYMAKFNGKQDRRIEADAIFHETLEIADYNISTDLRNDDDAF